MILNMPVNNGAANTPVSQGENEYSNFLKRKNSEQEIEQRVTATNSSKFEPNKIIGNNNWKKRHIDQKEPTNYFGQENTYSNQQYKSSDHNNLTNAQLQNSETQDANSGTFNIIENNSFISDLFAYDANLVVPVSVNSLSDNILAEQPIFSTPSTVCANANIEYADNGDNWQASDLLELDHRYNSSLQTEISQIHPTVSLKTPPEVNSLNINSRHDLSPQQQTQFLLPPKPISQQTSSTLNNKRLDSTSISSPSAVNSFTNDNLEQDCDFEDKNLSWLLNFKFDEFPHLNPDVGNINSSAKNSKTQSHTDYSNMNNSTTPYSSSNSSNLSSVAAGKTVHNNTPGINGSLISERSKSPKNSSKTCKKFEELVMEVTAELEGNDMVVAENIVIEESPCSSQRAPKKPPFTYTELIEYALEDKGELTVSGIYQWISDRFPFYKSNDDRWKNSVRHNLSINPHFRKGHKAPQGAGHLWTISSGDSAENVLAWEHKKQRLDLFFKMESINRERLQQHHQKQQQERMLQNGSGKHKQHIGCQQDQCLYDEAAVAAAAIQQEMLQQTHNNNDASIQNQNSVHAIDSAAGSILHDLPYNDVLTDEELRKTAGQILNGIHRDVEVQSVNQTIIGTYQDVLLDNDYLNPIHKDVVVNESGLRHSSHSTVLSTHCHSNHSSSSGPYYVTEIDPMELGIQISNGQHNHHYLQHNHRNNDLSNSLSEDSDVVLFNDEFNLNYFTYNPANDIVA